MTETNGHISWRNLFTAMIRAPLEERYLRIRQAEYERVQYEAAANIMQEVVRVVQPETDGWIPIGASGATPRILDSAEQQTLREQAIKASTQSPLPIGYLGSLQRFVMGQGPRFTPITEDETLSEAMRSWWAKFCALNKWDALEDEIAKRTWRDGNVFLRRIIEQDGDRQVAFSGSVLQSLRRKGIDASMILRPEIPVGMVKIRIIDPDYIADPEGVISHGILTDPDDVQTVLGYMFSPGGKFVEMLSPDEIEHIKIQCDSDCKVGRSILEPILSLNAKYEQWLDYRIVLSKVRAAIALVRKVEGTATQIANIRNQEIPQRNNAEIRGDQRQRMLKPGTIITASPGVSYEYVSPNLQAQDAQHDGREIKLNMAAATGLPEYMMTGDSSNANYASTMISEAPGVREFESWQDFFTPVFKRIWLWVMTAAAEAGQIPISPDELNADSVDLNWPPLISRNEKEETESNQVRFQNKVLSREGWALRDGIDWEKELPRLQQDRNDEMEFMPPLPAPNEARQAGIPGG